ncbi:MAG: hypothetical protein ACKO9B_08195 [Planctomycetota bacterium]
MTSPPYAFEVSLHAASGNAAPGDVLTDAWGTWPTIVVPREALAQPMEIRFDEALERLGALERLFVEPDGSFVWSSPRSGISKPSFWWQVDGNAFERAGRVLLVDLKGSCPATEFDRVLTALGWPTQAVMVQLVRPALFLDEATFRRHAAARGRAGDGEGLRPA